MVNPMNLAGKKYIVTGASSGLGRQVCILLSELGASVVLIARNEERLNNTLKMMQSQSDVKHAIYMLDLNDLDGIEPLIKQIIDENGKMNGFVHSAGEGTLRPLPSTTYSFMEKMMRVNVLSFVEIARVLTKKKHFHDGGSIVAVSSLSSKRGNKAKTAYSASKGALDSLIISLSIELGIPRKIRVNTVNPGWINTDMYRQYLDAVGDDRQKEIENGQFLGIAEPKDIAGLIAFLLSEASRQITGQSIIIDGGNGLWTK